jgi:hypothetical protein
VPTLLVNPLALSAKKLDALFLSLLTELAALGPPVEGAVPPVLACSKSVPVANAFPSPGSVAVYRSGRMEPGVWKGVRMIGVPSGAF